MLTRKQKIARLLDSSSDGERAAAQAALDRLTVDPPAPGSPEWCKAMIEHKRMVSECAARISDPDLSTADVTTIRRWTRFVGKPWEDGAEELRRIHRQLMSKTGTECRALPSPMPASLP